MTWEWFTVLTAASLLMLTGVLGSLIPALPSTPLVFLGALCHWLVYPTQSVSPTVLTVIGLMMLLSLGLDFVASVLGAKKMGATRKGIVGVLVGGIIGLFFGLPGVLIGPVAGAILFEIAGGTDVTTATKAGFGAVLGLLAGALGRFAFAIAMSGLFFANLFYRQLITPPKEPSIALLIGLV